MYNAAGFSAKKCEPPLSNFRTFLSPQKVMSHSLSLPNSPSPRPPTTTVCSIDLSSLNISYVETCNMWKHVIGGLYDWFLSFSTFSWFLWFTNISLYGYAPFFSSVHQLTDAWVVSTFWLYEWCCYEHSISKCASDVPALLLFTKLTGEHSLGNSLSVKYVGSGEEAEAVDTMLVVEEEQCCSPEIQ